jgi:outer membrane receptor for ferrienterochelin and colicins
MRHPPVKPPSARSAPRHPHFPAHSARVILSALACATLAQTPTDPAPMDPTASPADIGDLGRVVVTGTRSERLLTDAPVRTELVLPADLPAIQAYKLSEAMEYTTGLLVENSCQTCNTTEIRMLGLPQRYLAILHDGIPNLTGLAGVYGIEQLPAALIEQVEIVKGGGSTLYGPGAVAGVINVIPRTPTRTGAQFDAAWNSMQGQGRTWRPNRDFLGVADFVAPSGNAAITLHGYHSYVNPVDVIGDGFSEVSLRDLSLGGSRAFWKPTPDSRLTLDYMTAHEFRRGGSMAHGQITAPPNTVELAEQIDSRRHVGTLSWEQDVGADWGYRVSVSASAMDRDSYYGGTGPLGGPSDPDWNPNLPPMSEAPVDADGEPIPPFNVDWSPELGFGRTDDQLVFVDGQLHYRGWDPHTLTVGVQYRNERIRDDASFRLFGARYENVGILLQDEWEPSTRWTLVGGFRVDQHSEVDQPIFSPRASALWKARRDLRFRGSVSTGFRAPELFDEDLHVDNVGGELQVVQLSPDLKQESSLSTLLGMEWDINLDWTLEVNGFQTWIRDTFFNEIDGIQDEPGLLKRTKVNSGSARVYGAEVNLGYRWNNRVRFDLGYVEQRAEFSGSQLLLGDPTGGDPDDNPIFSRRFQRTPERYGVFRMFFTPGASTFFLGGRVTGPMEIPHVMNDLTYAQDPTQGSYPGQPALLGNALKTSPWFLTLDASVSHPWKLGGSRVLTTTLGCRNLLNAFQEDLDRGKYRDASYVYGPRFPRTLFATVSLTF